MSEGNMTAPVLLPNTKLSPCRKVDTPALRHTLASPCSAVQFLKVPLSRRNRATLFSVPSSRVPSARGQWYGCYWISGRSSRSGIGGRTCPPRCHRREVPPAGADIQEPVRCLVQCIDMNRLDWKGDMSAGPPCPSSRYNPMPVPIHIHSGAFSSMAVMGPGTGYRRTVPSWGSKRLRLWQPLSIYILRNLFRCH